MIFILYLGGELNILWNVEAFRFAFRVEPKVGMVRNRPASVLSVALFAVFESYSATELIDLFELRSVMEHDNRDRVGTL